MIVVFSYKYAGKVDHDLFFLIWLIFILLKRVLGVLGPQFSYH